MSAPPDQTSTETPTAELTEGGRLLRQAMELHRDNELREAQHVYEQALRLEPDNPDVLNMFGVLLCGIGRPEEAHASISRAIAVLPQEAMFHNNLGNALMQLERPAEAEQAYRQALLLDPERYDAMNNLAVVLGRRGQLEDAESLFKQVVESVPRFLDARENLAQLYVRTGRTSDAVMVCVNGLVTSPRATGLRQVLAFGYRIMGMNEQAKAVYSEWLQDEPGNAYASHHYAALTGEAVPTQASSDYVRHTFDTFAGSFESKLAELGYRAPGLVVEALTKACGEGRRGLRIADAGCGTGLCGPLLRPMAGQLVGVDLSKPMLERAAVKKVYDELVAADLVEFLRSRPGAFDAIVSADTLCYFGVLEEFAAAARAALVNGGTLVFTVEAIVDDTLQLAWQLQPHGRYAHRRDYVERVLQEAGFELPVIDAVTLREEGKKPVAGWLVTAGAVH